MPSEQIGLRVPATQANALARVALATGIDRTSLIRSAINALIQSWEERGQISFPMALSPEKELREAREEIEEVVKLLERRKSDLQMESTSLSPEDEVEQLDVMLNDLGLILESKLFQIAK